jgi:hypothetical protein
VEFPFPPEGKVFPRNSALRAVISLLFDSLPHNLHCYFEALLCSRIETLNNDRIPLIFAERVAYKGGVLEVTMRYIPNTREVTEVMTCLGQKARVGAF